MADDNQPKEDELLEEEEEIDESVCSSGELRFQYDYAKMSFLDRATDQ